METKIYLKGLKAKRKALGLSQSALAEQLAITQAAVTAWECGEKLPAADRLPELASILGCSIDELYVDPEEVAV